MKNHIRFLLLAVFLLFGVKNSKATTRYVDYVNGHDTASGANPTSDASIGAWKHIPGMRNCTNACASFNPTSDDQIVLKGGVSWPRTEFPIYWNWSGSTGHAIYIMSDISWYSGASWTFPKWDGGGAQISGMGTEHNYFRNDGDSHIRIRGIELTGFYNSSDGSFGDAAMIYMCCGGTDIQLEYSYVHNFGYPALSGTPGVNATCGSGCSDAIGIVWGDQNSPWCDGCGMNHVYVDGSDGPHMPIGGVSACYLASDCRYNVIHDVANCFLPTNHGVIAYNTCYNIYGYNNSGGALGTGALAFDGGHMNFLEHLQGNGNNGTFYIHDNVFHDGNGEAAFIGNPGEVDYVWNNVWYDLLEHAGELNQASAAAHGTTLYWFNNSVQGGANITTLVQFYDSCMKDGHPTGTWTRINYQNNHCITSGNGTSANGIDSSQPITATTLVTTFNGSFQTQSAAAANGYSNSSTYVWQPQLGTGATVGTGTNMCSVLPSGCTGELATANTDTAYGAVVGADHLVSGISRTPVSRGATWDRGAFQFQSGSPSVQLSTSSINFGSNLVGSTSPGTTITLTNNGSATLNISGISFSGTDAAMFAKTSTCGSTLAASSSCSVTVTFNPTSSGSKTASLSFATDAPSSPDLVSLTGTGNALTFGKVPKIFAQLSQPD